MNTKYTLLLGLGLMSFRDKYRD